MSLSRVRVLARLRPLITFAPHRNGSSSAHDEHAHHEEPHYAKEGFTSPFWRNTVLCSLLVAAAYKYAPEPGNDVYLTRWIALYTYPRELWTELAAKHTTMSLDQSETKLLLSDAQKAPVHRYRYPQSFEQKSPFLTPVGMDMDTSKFIVKGDE